MHFTVTTTATPLLRQMMQASKGSCSGRGFARAVRSQCRCQQRRSSLCRGFQQDKITGVHHVAFICEDLHKSLHFYKTILGLPERDDRPDDKLPYDGAWLQLGPEMLHLMELNNPDAGIPRPEHGGRDRHFCVGMGEDGVKILCETLDREGISYTASKSGRPAIFFRDPDDNTLEVVETANWRT